MSDLPDTIPDEANFIAETDVASSMADIQKALLPNDILDCQECGDLIDPKRKEIMPSAIYCVECQNWLAARKPKNAVQPRQAPESDWKKLLG